MRRSRTVILSLLFATGCLVLVWAGMAIGQGGAVLSEPASSPPPAEPSPPPDELVPVPDEPSPPPVEPAPATPSTVLPPPAPPVAESVSEAPSTFLDPLPPSAVTPPSIPTPIEPPSKPKPIGTDAFGGGTSSAGADVDPFGEDAAPSSSSTAPRSSGGNRRPTARSGSSSTPSWAGRGGGKYGGYGDSPNPLKDVKTAADLASLDIDKLNLGDRYLESHTQSAVQGYKNAADARERANLKAALVKLIQKHFEVRHEIRRREIAELEAQVKQLRGLLDKRKQAQKNIVDMRLQQFIRTADGLGWDASLGGRGSTSPRLPSAFAPRSSSSRSRSTGGGVGMTPGDATATQPSTGLPVRKSRSSTGASRGMGGFGPATGASGGGGGFGMGSSGNKTPED